MHTHAGGHAMQCMEIRGGSQAVEESLTTPGLDVWFYSRPFEGAVSGGDLHYLSVCGGGVITRLLVADVSGHGESVAGFSNSLRALLRKNINTKSQTRLVRDLNREFTELAQLEHFATAVIATYLAGSRRLTVCNAGHPHPLRYSASAGRWAFLDKDDVEPGNLPLGLDDESAYHQFAVTMGRGDIVIVYTDAVTEAASPSGALLGEEGLLALARGIDPSDPKSVGPALLAGVECQRDGCAAADDLTVVTLHHNGEGPRKLSVREKVGVYAKVFGLQSY